jgi:flavin reductase (DIM6/NTAB) family NADH-FMN oxidoreductase RutF
MAEHESDRLTRAAFQDLAVSLVPAGAHLFDFGAGPGIDAHVFAEREFSVAAYERKPLIVGVGYAAELDSVLRQPGLKLKFVDRHMRRVIGSLRIERSRQWQGVTFFDVHGGQNRCLGIIRRLYDAAVYRWRDLLKHSAGFTMSPRAVEQTMIFYLCPRPVFLISVQDGEHSNLFPMDLLGPVGAGRLTLALRSTSPSVATIRDSRRLAMSAMSVDDCKSVYRLGEHHRKLKIDLTSLPFTVTPSQTFSLPIPIIALETREVEIMDFVEVGSHTLFMGRVVAQQGQATAAQLFHTCGPYQKLRERTGSAFQVPR